jgi:hypothetical protein
MKMEVPENLWRIRDVDTVPIDWANEVCEVVDENHDEVRLRPLRPVESLDYIGQTEDTRWFLKHVEAVPGGLADGFLYLSKKIHWKRLNEIAKIQEARRDRENEWITGGEHVRYSSETARTVLTDGFNGFVWRSEDRYRSRNQIELDGYLKTNDGWESMTSWYGGVIVKTPAFSGGPFVIRTEHGVGCNHDGECIESGEVEGLMHEVEWYRVHRLLPLPPEAE